MMQLVRYTRTHEEVLKYQNSLPMFVVINDKVLVDSSPAA